MLTVDDYPSLALFARVVALRSFTAAAREENIAKSAVSRRVRLLEERLGVALLTRTTRAVVPTAEGSRVYEHAAKLVECKRAAEDAVDRTGAIRGRIRVNAPVTFAHLVLAREAAIFLARHPEVAVDLVADDRIADVVNEGFDVVIRMGRLADSSLVARRLLVDRLVVCGSPEYLAKHGAPRRATDLAQHHCLHYARVARDAEWRFRREGYAVATEGRFDASDGTVLREAAIAGLGLAVLPSFMVAKDVREGRLELVLEGARRAQIGVYAITAHRAGVPSRVRAFVDALARSLAKQSLTL